MIWVGVLAMVVGWGLRDFFAEKSVELEQKGHLDGFDPDCHLSLMPILPSLPYTRPLPEIVKQTVAGVEELQALLILQISHGREAQTGHSTTVRTQSSS